VKLTFSQLEGLWIQNGGSTAQAPLMAAIALAESGGVPTARNDKDNGGTQSSFGLWQISTGTHNPPSSNWSDPNENARLAMGKLKSQGLKAWGTYTSGAYRRFLANGVPPSAPPSTGSAGGALEGGGTITTQGVSDVTDNCAWSLNLPVAGNTCIASKTQVRYGLASALLLSGAAVTILGLVLLTVYGLDKSTAVKDIKGAL
jgi:hypothetical protein